MIDLEELQDFLEWRQLISQGTQSQAAVFYNAYQVGKDAAARLEKAIAAIGEAPDDADRLKDYPNYWFDVIMETISILHGPDDLIEERTLAGETIVRRTT